MYPTIVFIVALWMSLQCIFANFQILSGNNTSKNSTNFAITFDMIVCCMWGWVYYLSH